MKRSMGQPGLIKMQVFNIPVQNILNGLSVVQNAVISGLGERHDARLYSIGVNTGKQRIGADFVLD